jgi:hypothetical protein
MASGDPFAYAILRVVPRADRGEAINVAVVLFCRAAGFLELRSHVPVERLAALDATIDADALAAQLHALESIARGAPTGGAVASQPPSERFHWLVAPASTIVVPSDVHTGISEDPRRTLDELFEKLVR